MGNRLQYLLELMDRREREFEIRRGFLPIILGDEGDRQPASMSWLIAGIACLFIEFGFACYFFSRILNWDPIASVALAAGLVATLSLGLEYFIEHHYLRAQKAAADARSVVADPSTADNLLAVDAAEDDRNAAREKYSRVRHAIAFCGCVTFMIGVVLLAVERVRLEIGSEDTLSGLAYGYNILLLVGAGLISASVFHGYSRRNAEVRRLNEIDEGIRRAQTHKITLLKSWEVGNDTGFPLQEKGPGTIPAPKQDETIHPVGTNGAGGGTGMGGWDDSHRS